MIGNRHLDRHKSFFLPLKSLSLVGTSRQVQYNESVYNSKSMNDF